MYGDTIQKIMDGLIGPDEAMGELIESGMRPDLAARTVLASSSTGSKRERDIAEAREKYPTFASLSDGTFAGDNAVDADLLRRLEADQKKIANAQIARQQIIDALPGNGLKNAAVAGLNVVPEFLRQAGQVAQLATAGTVGQGLESFGEGAQQYVEQKFGTPRLHLQGDQLATAADKLQAILDNPGGTTTKAVPSLVASMGGTSAVGRLAGKGAAALGMTPQAAGKVAQNAATNANAILNASQTFSENDKAGVDLARNILSSIITGAVNKAVGGKLEGGAEGMVARGLTDKSYGAGNTLLGGALRGGLMGAADELNDNTSIDIGKSIGTGTPINLPGTFEDSLVDMLAGGLLGTVTGGATARPKTKDELQAEEKARLDDMAAQVVKEANAPYERKMRETELDNQLRRMGVLNDGKGDGGKTDAAKSALNDIIANAVSDAEKSKQADPRAVVEEKVQKPDAKLPEVKDATMGAAKDVGAAQTLPGSDQVVRLQNRDRSTPSSVNQMAKIAGNLDYGRLSPGRDFGNGAPVVSFGNVSEEQKGRTDYAAYNDGQRVPVQYAVVDASTILTSNDSSGNVVREYRTAGPDRMRAIAGNGRIAGVQLAYRNGKAEKYRQEMIEDAANFGVDPAVIERIPNPVLVRIMPSDQIRQDVGSASNTSSNLGLSIVEQANDDAANINFDVLEFDENGAPTEETVRKFVGQFDNAAAASMTDAAGHVNQQGMQRFHAALFKKAYGSDQLTSLYAETLDGEAKNILNGMESAAGNMFKLEGLGDLDIRPIVAEAAEMVVNARREGKTVSEYLQQGTMGQSADAAVVARMFDAYSRSGKEIGRVLNQAAQNALDAASGQGAMFTDTNPKPTDRAGILNQIGEETNAKLTKPQQNKPKPQEVANTEGTAPAAENVQRQSADGTGDGGNQGAVEPQPSRSDGRDSGPEVAEQPDVNPASQNAGESSGQSGLKFSKKRSKDDPVPRYKTRSMSNLTETEKEVIEEYFDYIGPKEAARIRDNIERLEYFTLPDGTKKRTPWGHLAIEAIFLRQAMRDLMAGRQPRAESMLDDGGMGNAIKAIKGGLSAIKHRLAVNGLLGNIEKCDYAVNSSFLNCNPSKACAYYCYAAEGRGGIPLTMVKSELTEYVVQHDPEWVAEQAVKEFTSMEKIAKRDVGKSQKNLIGDTQVALRLFEKGDGNENWLPVIKALNDRGVRVHVFSKRPEFLRKVPDMNLRLLSVDSTNIEVADQNQDLKLAFVYEGEKHIPVLRKLFERGQIGVVLPVKLNGEYMSKEAVGQLKESIPGVGHNVCPIDAGRVKIGEFTCSNCDKFGCNGCYYSKDKSTTTEAVLAAMDDHFRRISKLDGLSPMEQAKILRDEAQRITEIIGKVVRGENVTDAEIERAGISLEQIKRYREPSSSGTGSSSKIRSDGIAFLADEVGKRIRAESEIFERGRPYQQNRVYAGEAGDEPGGGARRSSPKPIRVWGRAGRAGGDQGRNQGSGSNSGLKPSVTEQHGGTTVESISGVLESDPEIGEDFARLRDSGKVVVVQSSDDIAGLRKESRSAMKSVEANIKRGLDALNRCLMDKTSVHRAMYRNGLGWVDFIWGSEGGLIKKNGSRKGEKGISHIMEARQRKDGLSEEEVNNLLSDIVTAIAKGTEVRRSTYNGSVNVQVSYGNTDVYLVKNPGNNAWVLTGFYRKSDDLLAGNPATQSTTSEPTGSRRGSGADSLSARTTNERHTTADSAGLGERRSMPSNSNIEDGGVGVKLSDDGSIQGAYDPNTGVVYLVAGNLTEDSARGVFLHEVGVHMAYSAREDMRPLTLQARNMINNGFKNGDARARRVKQRLVDAGIIDRVEDDIPAAEAEEAMAYLVEEAANSDARHPFRRWFDKLVAAIKQWLNKHGFNIELNADDFLEIALGNASALSRSGDAVNSGLKYSRRGSGNPPLPDSNPPVPTGVKKPLRQRVKEGVADVVSGPFFVSKDALGRRQWAFGDRVYTKLGEFTTGAMQQFLDVSNGLAPASKELRMQMRKMSAAVENAISRGSDFAKKAAVLSPSERELISDFIEQELKPGVVPPQSVVDIASGMQQALEVQADEAVRLGMLSKESRERYRGRYLPRFYANETPEQERSFFSRVFGRAAALRGMQGSHLKGRGKFSQAPAKSISQWVQLGWEVRDDRFEWKNGTLVAKQPAFAGMENSDEAVNIWRDWTKSEREQMGEERDGVYRFVMGYMEMQKDLAIGRLFMAISANPEWCSSTPQEGFVHVPKTEIEGTGGVLKYGALSGKYIDKAVLSHIQHIEEEQSAFMKAYKQAMAIWKEGKTAMNPVSHMNNTIGNMLAAHFAGVNMWDGVTYTKAIRSLIRAETDKHYREAKEAGLFSGSFTKTEMLEALQEMPEFKKKLQAEQGAFKNAADLFMNISTFGMRNKLRNAYEFEDSVFKMAIYRMCRDKGLSPEEAVDYAHQYVFVYDTLPAGARKLRDTMFPFFAWTYQAIPMVAKTALRYPHRFLLPAAVCYAINTMSFMAAAGDDDDDWLTRWKKAQELEKAERGLLPKYMEGSSAMFTPKFLRLGIDDATGMPRYMNISYMIPGGNFLDADNQMGGVPWPDMFMPNHPLVNAFMTYMANKDMFSGQEVVKKTDDTQEKLAKWTNYAWRQLSPAIAVGNYHWTRVMNGVAAETGTTIGAGTPFEYTGIDRYGNPMTLDMAMKNLVGLKVRALDYDTDFERIMRGIRSETGRIKSGVSQAYRNANVGAISKEAADDIRDKAIEKTNRLKEEAKTLRENRDTIRRLTGK